MPDSTIRRYHHAGRAGCVELRRRRNGARVGVYHAGQADLDPSGGPFVTVCEEHFNLVNHRTLALAKRFAVVPASWCEDCQDAEPRNP